MSGLAHERIVIYKCQPASQPYLLSLPCAFSLPTLPTPYNPRSGKVQSTARAPNPLIIIMLHSNVDISVPPGPWTPNLPTVTKFDVQKRAACMHTVISKENTPHPCFLVEYSTVLIN
ncbi:uncharacterized protein RSE6_06282 [Rhynchosporium secalis]|uniref:Uncharacterized protein n=1 Tax=Rhynchosporium secalis TaxID=38038 RepID=A0A1E1MB39_RHYSE|nr:uncharacterized protein RSE6_06282 [Rhynchosporium secalis]